MFFASIVLVSTMFGPAPTNSAPIVLEVKPGLQSLDTEFQPSPADRPEGYVDPDISWSSADPITLRFKTRTSLLEGWSSLFFVAEAGKTYVIDSDVIDWQNKKRTRKRWIIKVEGAPVPPAPVPPGPVPGPTRPEGVAGLIFDQAKKVGDPESALLLAGNYETVSSMIAAGGLKTMEEAQKELFAMNKGLKLDAAKWTNFSEWMDSYSQKTAPPKTLIDMQRFMDEVVRGLEALTNKETINGN
jgi:hypothetical protein